MSVFDGRYGAGTGPILLDNVKCKGSEDSILGCPQLPFYVSHDCQHSEDVGVRCVSGKHGQERAAFHVNSLSLSLPPASATCEDNDVRLVNGRVAGQGRIEICYGNQWGTVCSDSLDETEAEVICRQLDFNNGQGIY